MYPMVVLECKVACNVDINYAARNVLQNTSHLNCEHAIIFACCATLPSKIALADHIEFPAKTQSWQT